MIQNPAYMPGHGFKEPFWALFSCEKIPGIRPQTHRSLPAHFIRRERDAFLRERFWSGKCPFKEVSGKKKILKVAFSVKVFPGEEGRIPS